MENNNKKTFVIVGASGYIAKRHIESISFIGGELLAVYDPSDQIGIIDSFFDDTKFFNDFFFFNNWMIKNRCGVDYFVICTPNYTHYYYIRYGLKYGCNIICEKPLVLDPIELEGLKIDIKGFKDYKDLNIYPILQARIHPKIIELKKRIEENKEKVLKYNVDCIYMSKRSEWYDNSWKGQPFKSGGVLMNIGIHLFDTLYYLFGNDHKEIYISENSIRSVKGLLRIGNADIHFHVSVNKKDMPEGCKVIRQIKINDEDPIEFSEGFSQLHFEIYKRIVEGNWNIDLDELINPIEKSCLINFEK